MGQWVRTRPAVCLTLQWAVRGAKGCPQLSGEEMGLTVPKPRPSSVWDFGASHSTYSALPGALCPEPPPPPPPRADFAHTSTFSTKPDPPIRPCLVFLPTQTGPASGNPLTPHSASQGWICALPPLTICSLTAASTPPW